MKRRALAAAVSAIVAANLAVVATPHSARAAVTSTNLSLSDFGRIAVDPVKSHVFVSGRNANEIVVTDFSGNIVKTITGETGATAMVVLNGVLYVALPTEIDRIDTTTLTETSALVTGLTDPEDLVYAGSRLWTTTGATCGGGTSVLASVDPTAITPTVTTYATALSSAGLSGCAGFASNPATNPGLLLGYIPFSGNGPIATFDVSGSPTLLHSQSSGLGNLEDVAITPDQTHFITASGAPYEFDEWNVSDLSADGTVYPANAYPTSVASGAGNNGVMVGGLNGVNNDLDTYAYEIGNPGAPLASQDLFPYVVPARGVAISPDGLSAFVISNNDYNPPNFLNVIPIAPAPPAGTPGPPTNVTADAGVGSATVSWTAPAHIGDSAITGYTVKSSGGAVVQVGATVTSVTIAGLSPTSHTFTVSATNSQGTGFTSAPSAAATPSDGGTYHPVTPFRVLDTRNGTGGVPIHRVKAGGVVTLSLGGVDGIPVSTASAAVLNVAVTNPSGPGYVTAYPAGATRPNTANLNYVAGQTVPNLVEVALNATAQVTLYVGGSSTDLVADLQGWVGDSTNSYGGAGLLLPMQTPDRILDTRTGTGAPKAKLGPGQSITLQVTGAGTVPPDHVAAAVLNVAVTGPTQASYLTVYPSDAASRPVASNLNFVAGQTIANRVIVPLSSDGKVTIYNGYGSVNVIADINARITDATGTGGLSFVATVPARLVDTRTCRGCKLGPGYVLDLQWVGSTFINMFVFNVAVTNTTGNGYLTLYADDGSGGLGPPPLASDLNYVAKKTVPNMSPVALNPGNESFNVFNGGASADVILDADGYYGVAPSGTCSVAATIVQGNEAGSYLLPKTRLPFTKLPSVRISVR